MSRAALAAALVALAACAPSVEPPRGRPAPAGARPERGGVLRLATLSDLRTLDPAVAFDEVSSPLLGLIFATLVEPDAEGRGFVPGLAEAWEASPDGRLYRFRLRPGARFHDGAEVRAADVKRSLERALHPDTPCPVRSFYERIAGFDDFTSRRAPALAGVRVEGEYALAIELSEPDATLLAVLALPTAAPLCASAGATYDRRFAAEACGAGPFRLASWRPGRSARLERFGGYYHPELPHLDGLEWSLLVPSFTQRLRFERGELDLVRELTETDGRLFRLDPRWRGQGAWEAGRTVKGIFLNAEAEPFQSAPLRRAAAAAIDREAIASLRPDMIRPAYGLLPPALPGHGGPPAQRFDYAAALGHMREAGYAYDPATGRGGYPRELDFVTVNDSFDAQVAEIYQQQLARVGLRVRVRALSYPAYLAETGRRGAAALGMDGWVADFADPADFFEPLFSSASIAPEDSQNRAFYANPRLDALLARARREREPAARLALYGEAERVLADDAPWVFAYYPRAWEMWQGYVHGYRPQDASRRALRSAWLGREGRERLGRGGPGARSPLGAFAALGLLR
ncbi:MAG TPA: ABC transporter substrate-binding protein [Polyangiaceae bacterium]|nr:ABC transporter substrate-binding protein [Polyangiaceae bacterium]